MKPHTLSLNLALLVGVVALPSGCGSRAGDGSTTQVRQPKDARSTAAAQTAPPRNKARTPRRLVITHSIYSGRVSPKWSVKSEAAQNRVLDGLESALRGALMISEYHHEIRCGLGAYLVHTSSATRELMLYRVCPNGYVTRHTYRKPPRQMKYDVFRLSKAPHKALCTFLASTRHTN